MLQGWLLAKWEKSYRALADIKVTALKKRMKCNALAGLSSVVGYATTVFIFQGFLFYFSTSGGFLAEHSGILRELPYGQPPMKRKLILTSNRPPMGYRGLAQNAQQFK